MNLPAPGLRYDPQNEAATRAAIAREDVLNIKRGRPVTVTGSRGGNDALAALLTALADIGLIVDETTA